MKHLRLSDELKLPLEVAGEAIGILATRGAGKSYTSAVLIEELHEAGVQLTVLDPAGVYWGLRTSANGKDAGLPLILLGGAHGDVPLEPTAGALIADLLVGAGQSLILDLSDFPSKGAKTRFVTDFAERLYFRKSRARTTLHLVIDEAHEFAPQKPQRDEARMLGAIEHLIRGGRTRGLGATLITQRSAALNKTVLDLIDTLIAMRVLSPRDRKVVSDWIVHKDLDGLGADKAVSALPSMKTGAAWVWSPVREVLQHIHIRRIRTFDSYATPKPGEKRIEPTRWADIDIAALGEQMKATAERARENDPKALRAELAKVRRELDEARARPAEKKVERIEVPVITDKQIARLEKALNELHSGAEKHATAIASLWSSAIAGLHDLVTTANDIRRIPVALTVSPRLHPMAGPPAGTKPLIARPNSDTALTGPEQRILDAIAWMNAIGVPEPENTAVAFIAGYSPGGGAYNNPKGKLRGAGLIEYRGDRLALTETGRQQAYPTDIPKTREGLHTAVLARLPGPESKLLTALILAYPRALTNEELAEHTGYSVDGGAFNNPKSRLRTLGLVYYPERRQVAAREILFP